MSKIRIGQTPEGKSIQIDLGVLSETRMFINATSGGGKSSLMRMIAERAAKHTQILMIDWEGEYSTLREKVDLLIVGNMEGADIPADLRTAKRLALRLLETKVSAVIDLSELEDVDKNCYAAEFIMAMVNAPRKLWHSVFVFADEYQELAPQSAGGRKSDDPLMQSLRAFKKLGSLGRKRGYCLIAATNRITKVNKDAISTLKNQLTGQTVLDVDMDRAADNLGFRKETKLTLRDIEPGDWYVFGPALNVKGVNLFHADQGETTHLGAGQRNTLVIPAPTSAIRNALAQFQDLPAEVKREHDEMDELRRENLRLKMETQRRPVQVQPRIEAKIERVEIPVFRDGDLNQLAAFVKAADDLLKTTGNLAADVRKTVESARQMKAIPERTVKPVALTIPRQVLSAARSSQAHPNDDAGEITRPQQAILDALARFESWGLSDVVKQNAAVFANQSPSSSGFTNNLGRLRTLGLIEYPTTGCVALTDAGRARANPPAPIHSVDELHEAWYAKLSKPKIAILRALIVRYPDALAKDALAELSGQSATSSGFTNNLGALRSLGIVSYPQPGFVAATKLLFPDL